MTKKEANEMLDKSPADEKRSRINPALTRADAVKIVKAGINCPQTPDPFGGLMEKRVWQVYKDRKRPEFTA